MKLIIDIPNELAEKEHWYTDKEIWTVIKAAQNGIPLEQIRDEIEHWESDDTQDDYQIGAMDMQKYVLRVIDKYTKGEQG